MIDHNHDLPITKQAKRSSPGLQFAETPLCR